MKLVQNKAKFGEGCQEFYYTIDGFDNINMLKSLFDYLIREYNEIHNFKLIKNTEIINIQDINLMINAITEGNVADNTIIYFSTIDDYVKFVLDLSREKKTLYISDARRIKQKVEYLTDTQGTIFKYDGSNFYRFNKSENKWSLSNHIASSYYAGELDEIKESEATKKTL